MSADVKRYRAVHAATDMGSGVRPDAEGNWIGYADYASAVKRAELWKRRARALESEHLNQSSGCTYEEFIAAYQERDDSAAALRQAGEDV